MWSTEDERVELLIKVTKELEILRNLKNESHNN